MADNVNLSPDMIESLVDMLKNSGFNSNNVSDSKNRTNPDSSNSSSSVDFSEIFKNFSSNIGESSPNSKKSSSFGNLDFETILKIKSIMETINSTNNQDSNLLYSLKPYLRKSKQEKLDQYINILKISQVSKILKKGDAK